MIHILVLDDDPGIREAVQQLLSPYGFPVLPCENVAEANTALLTVATSDSVFAIVDLFLLGNEGMELSNDFIKNELIPRNISFGRFTSAPGLVPKELEGQWVIDKRLFYRQESALLDPLLVSISEMLS